MITKYSRGIPIVQPISGIDTNLTLDVLSKKQEKYDTGFLALQKSLNEKGSIDLIRQKDSDYLDNKLKETTDNLNNLGNIDFGDAKLTGALASDINRITEDPTLKRAIISTSNIRQLQSRWGKMKENSKADQYWSQQNEDWDNNNINEYISGKTDYFTQNSPTRYYDYNKILNEHVSKMKAQATSRTQGAWVINGEELTEEKIIEAARATLLADKKAQFQMKIDGWHQYQGVSEEALRNNFVYKINQNTSEINNKIKEVEAGLVHLGNSDADNEKRLEAKNIIQGYKSKLEAYNNDLKSLDSYKADDLKFRNILEDAVAGVAKKYSGIFKLTVRENKFSLLDYKQKMDNLNAQRDFKYKIKLEENKQGLEYFYDEKRYKEGITGGRGSKVNADGTPDINPVSVGDEVAVPEDTNYSVEIDKQLQQNGNTAFNIYRTHLAEKLAERGLSNAAKQINQMQTISELNTLTTNPRKLQGYENATKDVKDYIYNSWKDLEKAYNNVRIGKVDDYNSAVYTQSARGMMNEIAVLNEESKYLIQKKEALVRSKLKQVYGKSDDATFQQFQKANNVISKLDLSQEAYNKYVDEHNKLPYVDAQPDPLNFNKWQDFKIKEAEYKAGIKNNVVGKINLLINEELQRDPYFSTKFNSSYVIDKEQLGKEIYSPLRSLAFDAFATRGGYIAGESDPYPLNGRIEGKVAKNNTDRFNGITRDNVELLSYNPTTGKALLEVKKGEKEVETVEVKLNPQAQQEMFRTGIPQKHQNLLLKRTVDNVGSVTLNTQHNSLPFSYKLRKDGSGSYVIDIPFAGDNITLKKTRDPENNKLIGFQTVDEAKENLEQALVAIESSDLIKDLPKTEETKALLFKALKMSLKKLNLIDY